MRRRHGRFHSDLKHHVIGCARPLNNCADKKCTNINATVFEVDFLFFSLVADNRPTTEFVVFDRYVGSFGGFFDESKTSRIFDLTQSISDRLLLCVSWEN